MKTAAMLVLSAACAGTTAQKPTTACFYDCPPADDSPPCFYDCKPAAKTAESKPVPATGALGPLGDKVQLLREAANQLEKATAALGKGNKRVAEQLFSTAEILAPNELAPLGAMFRQGAPPRVTTPTVKVDPTAAPQPEVAGNSETEDEAEKVPPPPKIEIGSLTGSMQIDGRNASGTYGLVTLEPVGVSWKPRTAKHHVIEQRGREFRPRLMAIAVGSTVSFPNFDPFFHNVFSTSAIAAFDLGLYKPGEARTYTFPKEGIIRLGCNLHANMSGYLVVVAAPAYVVTDNKGRFSFRRLAPGKYTVRAWSEKSTTPITRTITIKPGTNEIALGVKGDAPVGPQPDKFGGARPPDPPVRSR